MVRTLTLTLALIVAAVLALPVAAQDAPTTPTATVEGPRGGDGWFTGPVDVHLDHGDPDDGGWTEYRLDGGPWQVLGQGEEVIYDGSQESLDRWRMAPSGSFERLPDGSLHTVGGLGMLWYPVEYGDVVLRFQWRDVRPAPTGASNSGVFVRFPDPDDAVDRDPQDRHACQSGAAETSPAWVAINCGHEIQIYDGATGEPQKTGSVYNFAPLDLTEARPGTQGEWQDYEIRVEGGGDWTTTIIRNGEVLQSWTNASGQTSSRDGDAPTDLRQFARGHIGIQNHGFPDHVQFRDIRVTRLDDPAPVRVADPGVHTVEHRRVDADGTVGEVRAVRFRIDDRAPALTAEPQDGQVAVTVDDTLDGSGATAIQHRVDGGGWVTTPLEEVLFDGTQDSLDRWRMAGAGSFELAEDDAMRTVGGMGMLWHPDRALGDVAITMQWRDARPGGQRSNGGVFVRFPDPDEAVAHPPQQRHACQLGQGLFLPEWVAIQCGHEIQVNDADVDPQKTGSIYNFASLGPEASRPSPYGEWNDYEVRTVGGGDYDITVARNGEVINSWRNAPGQQPARPFDPPTDLRQFASGHVGLQNHGDADTIDYRDVRVRDLGPQTRTIPVAGAVVELRAVDAAGNVGDTRRIDLDG